MPGSMPNDHIPGSEPLQPFMHSRRATAGRPDTAFYWLNVDGKPCVGKALSTELGPHVLDLVHNEREVLELLMAHQAPVCRLVEDARHPDWLVTEFSGLSLQLLGAANLGGWTPLPIQERVAVWAHFLRRAGIFVQLGAVPLDLSDRNLVVPVGSNGQLKLNEAVSIDHAQTVLPSTQLPGGALTRPVWIGAKTNRQLAPEIRDCLVRDQARFLERLRAEGAALPGTTPAVLDERQQTARIWLEYSAPQEVQQRVNEGAIEADKVIQYAVGHAIYRQLRAGHELTPALVPVLRRLLAEDPRARFAGLEEAANALKQALGDRLALASGYSYRFELPGALKPPQETTPDLVDLGDLGAPDKGSNGQGGAYPDSGSTILVGAGAGAQEATASPSRWGWYILASLVAAAAGLPFGTWLAGM